MADLNMSNQDMSHQGRTGRTTVKPGEARAISVSGRLGGWLSLSFILLIVVAMGLSGGFALNEGLTRFTLPFTSDDATQQITRDVEAMRAAPSAEAIGAISRELQALAQLTSVERFAASGLPAHGIHYTVMPKANQVLMLVHILFGAFCMLLGGLQFWPGFRTRYRQAHRRIGMIYVLTVPVSVLTVLVYMVLTPPHHIYAHLVAWVALWIFGVLALVAIAMAMRALKARRIFEHQAWMALSFGCLMVAPLLRLDWVLLAWGFPAIDQETLNLVTVGMMLPQTLLITYGLILVNRQYARPMTQRAPAAVAAPATRLFLRARPVFYALALLLLGVNLAFYVAGTGMSSLDASTAMVPSALRLREQAVLVAHPLVSVLFALSLSLAFPAVVHTLSRLLQPAESAALDAVGRAAPWLTLVAGITSCLIGREIGLVPNLEQLSGGTLYMVNGLVLSGFSLFFLGAQRVGQIALMKECLVFLLCLLPFPALFFLGLQVMSWLPLPADYLAAGQGFVLPVGVSAALLFAALFYVIHGQATREHN
ncbi:MAG: DUF2306 domain-containing protein [Moraxellaceae bacterium]|nr:DUF2306 domain-containing protein [Moraxellaceae bacterium]